MKNYNVRTIVGDLYASNKVRNISDLESILKKGKTKLSDGTTVLSNVINGNYVLKTKGQEFIVEPRTLRLMEIEIVG